MRFILLPLLLCLLAPPSSVDALVLPQTTHKRRRLHVLLQASPSNNREGEIRRKIQALKRQGRIGNKNDMNEDDMNDSNNDNYTSKIQSKLGRKKSQMLGFGDREDQEENDRQTEEEDEQDFVGQLGASSMTPSMDKDDPPSTSTSSSTNPNRIQIDPSIFDRPPTKSDDTKSTPKSEEELLELVAEKWAQKQQEKEQSTTRTETTTDIPSSASSSTPKQTTTGVGGSWTPSSTNNTTTNEMYKPKTGSWGAFPRPKDISKAYGGGRRVGAGYSKEDDEDASTLKTQQLLKEYRRKVGIDVPSERQHKVQIEQALQQGQVAMQRGNYAGAVTALESVTQWCSTNSRVGSTVYLELGMAYEAVGRTAEAYQVYTTLSDCRMEDVKYNAKRLCYGMEALQIMRDVSSDFSRSKTRNTFIDATGLDTIAQNFDDVYQTAYIDLEGSFYKQLTESVVRSHREARQVILQATSTTDKERTVGRRRIVQALRCLSRHFDEGLQQEVAAVDASKPTAFLNGKPIVKSSSSTSSSSSGLLQQTTSTTTTTTTSSAPGDFILLSADEMMQNLQGRWRLQLLADKQGDGVSFYNNNNSTTALQEFCRKADDSDDDNNNRLTFSATGPSGLLTIQKSGTVEMSSQPEQRLLVRTMDDNAGTKNLWSNLFVPRSTGFAAAVTKNQQIIVVDSILLITKVAATSSTKNEDKEHFAVWRRVQDDDDQDASSVLP